MCNACSFWQNNNTPPGGMGVGWNSKWVGWIPPVAIPNPDQPTLAIFLTHHYFCTEKEWIQIMILSIFGILGEKVKLSSRTCLLHLVPQINLVFSHFGDCSRALDSWEKLYPPPQVKKTSKLPDRSKGTCPFIMQLSWSIYTYELLCHSSFQFHLFYCIVLHCLVLYCKYRNTDIQLLSLRSLRVHGAGRENYF